MTDGQEACLNAPVEEDGEVRHPWRLTTFSAIEERQHHVDLKLRELVMCSPKVELVESESLAINLPSVGATVAVWTEGNQVFVIVGLAGCPRHNVVDVHFDISTGVDSASVPSLD